MTVPTILIVLPLVVLLCAAWGVLLWTLMGWLDERYFVPWVQRAIERHDARHARKGSAS